MMTSSSFTTTNGVEDDDDAIITTEPTRRKRHKNFLLLWMTMTLAMMLSGCDAFVGRQSSHRTNGLLLLPRLNLFGAGTNHGGDNNNNRSPPQPPNNNGRRNWLFSNNDGDSNDHSSLLVHECDDYDEDGDDEMKGAAAAAAMTATTTTTIVSSSSSLIRGGSTKQKQPSSSSSSSIDNTNLIKGSQATMSKTMSYWKEQWDTIQSKISSFIPTTIINPLSLSSNAKKSKQQQKQKEQREEELLYQLQTMPIQRVRIDSNTTVLPIDVVRTAVKRSGIIGNPLRTDRVQDLARTLKQWYTRKGYVLHSVTGATLLPESGTALITVQEPKVHKQPVDIIVCKEMVIDNDDENGDTLMTFKEYREKHIARKTIGYDRISKRDLNLTYIPLSTLAEASTTGTTRQRRQRYGRTNPNRIAQAMKLVPGSSFCWNEGRWNKIAKSGIFQQILRIGPTPMSDGTIQLGIIVTEPPPRHLEYGIGKSLYTGSWEGELDFEHTNLLGGGESIGCQVRRGTHDVTPTIRMKFSNDQFGLDGGYDIELFSDYLGGASHSHSGTTDTPTATAKNRGMSTFGRRGMDMFRWNKKSSSTTTSSSSTMNEEENSSHRMTSELDGSSSDGSTLSQSPSLSPPPPSTMKSSSGRRHPFKKDDPDSLFLRRGATFRLKNPIPTTILPHSVASASLERTSTRTGLEESIGSGSLTIGPFRKQLPLDARTQFVTTITTGSRLAGTHQVLLQGEGNEEERSTSHNNNNDDHDHHPRWNILPFASISATTRQIFPLFAKPPPLALPSMDLQPIQLQQQQQQQKPPVTLAFSHTVSTSTNHLPRHEANAMAIQSEIRGATPSSGRASSSIKGTTELRVPCTVPKLGWTGSVIVFGDWFCVQRDWKSHSFEFQSSIGLGLRKSVQGIPLKYDICYSKEGHKIKAMFGLGPDFDA